MTAEKCPSATLRYVFREKAGFLRDVRAALCTLGYREEAQGIGDLVRNAKIQCALRTQQPVDNFFGKQGEPLTTGQRKVLLAAYQDVTVFTLRAAMKEAHDRLPARHRLKQECADLLETLSGHNMPAHETLQQTRRYGG